VDSWHSFDEVDQFTSRDPGVLRLCHEMTGLLQERQLLSPDGRHVNLP